MIGLLDILYFFFFNDTATTEIYTLSLHDALPILYGDDRCRHRWRGDDRRRSRRGARRDRSRQVGRGHRSEEHTSELQSRQYLVCRLLLEKKKKTNIKNARYNKLAMVSI